MTRFIVYKPVFCTRTVHLFQATSNFINLVIIPGFISLIADKFTIGLAFVFKCRAFTFSCFLLVLVISFTFYTSHLTLFLRTVPKSPSKFLPTP